MLLLFNPAGFSKAKPSNSSKNFKNKAILCSQCRHTITTEQFYTEKNNSHIHSFANPHGYVFIIRCFLKAPGILTTGKYSSEFSWFKNHSWKISLCGKCMTHLGWKFSGKTTSFFAIIEDKIIKS